MSLLTWTRDGDRYDADKAGLRVQYLGAGEWAWFDHDEEWPRVYPTAEAAQRAAEAVALRMGWLRVGEWMDGRLEVGQSSASGLAMFVAELDGCRWRAVHTQDCREACGTEATEADAKDAAAAVITHWLVRDLEGSNGDT